ncbi:MAG: Brp/Blh family beta-carotene 15,15'-dioxygenase [Bacteroidota bacterium]
MHSVTTRRGGVSATVMAITVGFVIAGGVATSYLAISEPFLVLGLMLIIGLPHGATDHGLFESLEEGEVPKKNFSFYLGYVAVLGLYGLIWYLLPLLAFGIFMLLSIYHFRQSNWVSIHYKKAWTDRLHYLLWGAGILLTPILLHAEEAAMIVGEMTNYQFVVPSTIITSNIIIGLAIVNLLAILGLYLIGSINWRRFGWEVLGYGVLMALFFSNSLLLGFTVYFVFWHSLNSIQDQYRFFRDRLSTATLRLVYAEIGVVVVGAFTFCAIIWFGPGPEAALHPGIIGNVFIAISILTLPHMILVEQLYLHWSPTEKSRVSTPRITATKRKPNKPQPIRVPSSGGHRS